MNPFSLIGDLAGRVAGSIGDNLAQFIPSATYSYDFRPEKAQAQSNLTNQIKQNSLPVVRGFAGAQPIRGEDLQSRLAQARGADLPLLQNLPLLINAGNQLPANLDPLLPLILAIRETQGGRFNNGKNNPYNIRGQDLAGNTHFINYPDLQTATFGGQNPLYPGLNHPSEGLLGLLGQNPIYADFRRTGNLEDLFAHYSPPKDKNGPLQQQVQNYRWIRNQILGLPQEG